MILKCSIRCLNVCLIPIIMLAIKVLVRKIRGAELQHTWQLLMDRYIVGIVVSVSTFLNITQVNVSTFLNITQVNALGALLEVSNKEVSVA